MIEDWSSKTCPDIFHFVPYTWSFNFLLKEFELLTIANEWNWIDCFGKTPENGRLIVIYPLVNNTCKLFLKRETNARTFENYVLLSASIAFCGEIFDLSFALPFVDYLPSTVPIKFFIRVGCFCKLQIQ